MTRYQKDAEAIIAKLHAEATPEQVAKIASAIEVVLNPADTVPRAKLTREQVKAIRAEYSEHKGKLTMESLARKYGVSKATVSRAVNALTWR